MRYTEAQRQAIHKALVAAKPLLASEFKEVYSPLNSGQPYYKSRYICQAVRLGSCNRSAFMTCYMIMSRLYPFSSLDGWLSQDPGIGYYVYQRTPEVITRIQQHRHAWLDKLIEEFSN